MTKIKIIIITAITRVVNICFMLMIIKECNYYETPNKQIQKRKKKKKKKKWEEKKKV